MLHQYWFLKGSLSTLLFFLFLLWSLASSGNPSRISHADLDIQIGQAIFEKLWVFAPASTKSSDGLGPLYNARSCAQCHTPTSAQSDKAPVSLVIMLSIEPETSLPLSEQYRHQLRHEGFISEPVYGKQIQTFAYPGAYSEAEIIRVNHGRQISFPDQQQVQISFPEYQLESPAYGSFHRALRISARIAPRMQGLGILDAISDAAIVALEDPDDLNGDGISGRANRVYDLLSKTERIGRFGWKAAKASLEHQNLAALATDIGISSWLVPGPQGDCSTAQTECTHLAATTVTSVSALRDDQDNIEASKQMTDLLTAFTRVMGHEALLSAQAIQINQHPGKRLFKESGCLACHTDHFKLPLPGGKGSENVTPYSDLLLHDMGEALADNRREFQANGREWRIAPLWGIARYLQQTTTPMFLHDGRAASVEEAILWHGGEAETSKQRFMAMPEAQRKQLINFVETL